MTGSTNLSVPSCPRLLQALQAELAGPTGPRREQMASWAREVVDHLHELSPDQALDGETLLAAASAAFHSMMRSESWQYLLGDALRRPQAFARTLMIMLHGRRPDAVPPREPTRTLH